MIIISNDYWRDFSDQETGSKPIDKVEIELSAGTWTDITEEYNGGATFDQEKERAPDKISAGDTRYTFDNTEDTFTPTNSGSIFYNVVYVGKKIRFFEGFAPLGVYPQSTMIIKDVDWDYDEGRVYIYCQELIQRVVEENLNAFPSSLIPIPGAGNVGDGIITEIATIPFITVNENWTLAGGYYCISDSNKFIDFDKGGPEKNGTVVTGLYLPGATQADAGTLCEALYNAIIAAEATGTYTVSFNNSTKKFTIIKSAGPFNILWKTGVHGSDNTDTHIGTYIGYSDTADDVGLLSYTSDNAAPGLCFSVDGSVSGFIGKADLGIEFSDDATGGIKFTITQGSTVFETGDEFTFTTSQYPEWTNINPIKIVWSIFTGYNWDAGTQENWSAQVFDFDNTKTVDNTDINFTSFSDAIDEVTNNLTGYISYDKNAAEIIEGIILHFLGSIYTDNQGRIAISAYLPKMGQTLLHEFSDDKKVYTLKPHASTSNIINSVTIHCKSSDSFAWSDTDETFDDIYTNSNTTSITKYGLKNPRIYKDIWFSVSKAAQEWFGDRIIDKFGELGIEYEFATGLDALRINLDDRIMLTDSRTSVSKITLETIRTKRDFEAAPKEITIRGLVANPENWLFFGSSADEGDGISPQASDYDSATETDKQYGYFSQNGSTDDPQYFFN